MEQFCSLIKTRLRITANDISWWVPKALLNSQQNNCWCWRIFVITCHPNRRISTLSLPFLPFPSSFKFPSSPSQRTDQPVYWQVTLGWSSCCDTNKLCSLFHGPWQWLCPSWPQNKIVLEIGWIENWTRSSKNLILNSFDGIPRVGQFSLLKCGKFLLVESGILVVIGISIQAPLTKNPESSTLMYYKKRTLA